MDAKIKNVLFLCNGNSARSIIAEAILSYEGRGRFHAYSAGGHPTGSVHPLVLQFLQSQRMPAAGARSKSWDEFTRPGGPELDFVFTVCDDTAAQGYPAFPGEPMTAHWGVADPAVHWGQPDQARQAIRDAFHLLRRRISLFLSLPLDKLDRLALQNKLRAIGESRAGGAGLIASSHAAVAAAGEMTAC